MREALRQIKRAFIMDLRLERDALGSVLAWATVLGFVYLAMRGFWLWLK